jgi:hypothetical protein
MEGRPVTESMTSREAVVGFAILGAGWGFWRWAQGGVDHGLFTPFDVAAVALMTPAAYGLARGVREPVVDGDRVVIYRRGRVVFSRDVSKVAGFVGPGSFTFLRFIDDTLVYWPTWGPKWGPLADALAARIGPEGRLHRDDVVGLAARLVWPHGCASCGAAEAEVAELHARRGLQIGPFAFMNSRAVPAPICQRCTQRRAGAGYALKIAGFLAVIAPCLVLPLVPGMTTEPVLLCAALGALAFLAILQQGDQWLDAWVLGVTARLAQDGATVRMRFRDPNRRSAFERINRWRPPGA